MGVEVQREMEVLSWAGNRKVGTDEETVNGGIAKNV